MKFEIGNTHGIFFFTPSIVTDLDEGTYNLCFVWLAFQVCISWK